MVHLLQFTVFTFASRAFIARSVDCVTRETAQLGGRFITLHLTHVRAYLSLQFENMLAESEIQFDRRDAMTE